MSTFHSSKLQERVIAGEYDSEQIVWQHHSIVQNEDGKATVYSSTNDDNDDGYPDGEITSWYGSFSSVAAALSYAGVCRVGISGVIVTVECEGEEVREIPTEKEVN